MDKHTKNLIQWMAGIMVGVFILSMGVGRLERSKKLEERIVPVEAVINSIGRAGSTAGKYALSLSYSYNGQNYVGSVKTNMNRQVGDTVQIYIDPTAPYVCMEQSSVATINYVLIIVGAILAVFMLINTISEIAAIRRES